MAIVLLISGDYIRQNTNINDSVENSHIEPYIRVAQDLWIEQFIGTQLLEKLQTDGSSVSGNYLILRDKYVRPALCWWTMAEMLPTLNYKVDNGSLSQHTSENTTAIGVTEMNILINNAKKNAQNYTARLQDYLCENSSLFPEYTTNAGADVRPSKKYPQMFSFSGNNHQMHRDWYPNDNKRLSELP